MWQERHDEKKRNRAEPTLAERMTGEALYGLNPARAALRDAARRARAGAAARRTIYRMFVQEGSDASGDAALLRAARDARVEIETVSKHDLNVLTGSPPRPHNGVVLDASALTPTPIDQLPRWVHGEGSSTVKGPAPVWLALDEVVDPQNLGAVLRSAKFLGVAGVVVCAKNSAPLSPVVSKASAGALESMDVRSVGVMHRFLMRCVEDGWDVYGTAAEEGAADVADVDARGRPSVLVMGNEGAGLRTNVRRACTSMLRIAGGGGGGGRRRRCGQPERVRRDRSHTARDADVRAAGASCRGGVSGTRRHV